MSEKLTFTTLPCIATRDVIVQPGMQLRFDVSRPRSLASVQMAVENDRLVFLTAQRDVSVVDPDIDDVYRVCTICEVKQVVKGADGISRVRVEGVQKAKMIDFNKDSIGIMTIVRPLKTFSREHASEEEIDALTRVIKNAFVAYSQVVPRMPDELKNSVDNAKTPEDLYELIAFNISMPAEGRQQVLEAPSLSDKLSVLLAILTKETQILAIEKDIHMRVGEAMDRGQRDY